MKRSSAAFRTGLTLMAPRGGSGAFSTRQFNRAWWMHFLSAGAEKEGAMQHSDPVSKAEFSGGTARDFVRRPLRVVVVEDEMIISMDLQMLLEELQVEVVGTAISAEEADAVVAAERPDVVTMDINIQGDRDGVTAANEIFEKYGIRSIFVSAYGDAATMGRAEPAKPFGWVRKPIDKAELDQVLQLVQMRNV